MNKKFIIFKIAFFISIAIFSQTTQTIKVIVPNKADEVYITGNQESLGNWTPNRIKLEKISDFERAIEVSLTFPAEFKFTRGSWSSEGIIAFPDNPNLKIQSPAEDISNFTVKTWSDNLDTRALGLDYDIQYVDSRLMRAKRMLKVSLPQNYNPSKKYPVIYVTDAQSDNFDVVKSYVHALSRKQYTVIPESIVVGVYQQQRNDDFYATRTGQFFAEFLTQELIPFIDAKYNTSGFNTMVGHSNGAEYNHIMMLREDNPFRGFICLSTYLRENDKNEDRLSNFFKNYQGKNIYYFIANGLQDPPSRYKAGGVIDSIYQKNTNTKIVFANNDFKANHQTIVTEGLLDGLKFIYQDYSNIDKYPTIIDLDENYIKNIKTNYGINEGFTFEMIEAYYNDIINRKSKKEWEYLIGFIEKNGLWFGRGLDQVNKGNGYYNMGFYPETISSYNMAIDDIENIEQLVFYANIEKPINSYIHEGKIKECISFLERGRAALSKEYYLGLTYHIAKVSLQNKLSVKEGKQALAYCKANFNKNRFFNQDDLKKLEELI